MFLKTSHPVPISTSVNDDQSWQQAGGVALRILAEIDRKRPKLVVCVPATERLKAA